MSRSLDAHANPPTAMRDVYKAFQKLDKSATEMYSELLDLEEVAGLKDHRVRAISVGQPSTELRQIFQDFCGDSVDGDDDLITHFRQDTPVFELTSVPGKSRPCVASYVVV